MKSKQSLPPHSECGLGFRVQGRKHGQTPQPPPNPPQPPPATLRKYIHRTGPKLKRSLGYLSWGRSCLYLPRSCILFYNVTAIHEASTSAAWALNPKPLQVEGLTAGFAMFWSLDASQVTSVQVGLGFRVASFLSWVGPGLLCRLSSWFLSG